MIIDVVHGPLGGTRVTVDTEPSEGEHQLVDAAGTPHRYEYDPETQEFLHLEGAVAHYIDLTAEGGHAGWGVSYDQVWIDGTYDTEETALYAATLDDDVLATVHHISRVDGENRPISRADLDAAQAAMRIAWDSSVFLDAPPPDDAKPGDTWRRAVSGPDGRPVVETVRLTENGWV